MAGILAATERKAGDAEGTIAQLARPGRPADGVGRPTQMVRQQPVEHTGAVHGNALAAGAVVLLDHAAAHLVVVAHEQVVTPLTVALTRLPSPS